LNKQKVAPSQIVKIRVRTYQVAVDTEIHELRTRGDALLNILMPLRQEPLGRSDWEAFDEKHFKSESLIELMKKIEVSWTRR
jgi:2-methylcitrate dehydratase PrpD